MDHYERPIQWNASRCRNKRNADRPGRSWSVKACFLQNRSAIARMTQVYEFGIPPYKIDPSVCARTSSSAAGGNYKECPSHPLLPCFALLGMLGTCSDSTRRQIEKHGAWSAWWSKSSSMRQLERRILSMLGRPRDTEDSTQPRTELGIFAMRGEKEE